MQGLAVVFSGKYALGAAAACPHLCLPNSKSMGCTSALAPPPHTHTRACATPHPPSLSNAGTRVADLELDQEVYKGKVRYTCGTRAVHMPMGTARAVYACGAHAHG